MKISISCMWSNRRVHERLERFLASHSLPRVRFLCVKVFLLEPIKRINYLLRGVGIFLQNTVKLFLTQALVNRWITSLAIIQDGYSRKLRVKDVADLFGKSGVILSRSIIFAVENVTHVGDVSRVRNTMPTKAALLDYLVLGVRRDSTVPGGKLSKSVYFAIRNVLDNGRQLILSGIKFITTRAAQYLIMVPVGEGREEMRVGVISINVSVVGLSRQIWAEHWTFIISVLSGSLGLRDTLKQTHYLT